MRRFLLSAVAALATVSAAPLASAQTLKVVMHSDVKVLDPIWSGAYITRNHGYMLYDVLFAMDEKFQVKPQMVDTWTTSDDGLTWTFKLRDGLEWHDGQPVTAEDCIASLKRWSARDAMGQKLAQALKEYKVVDAKTFQIVLKEKFGAVIESLGKPSVVVPFMMPKRIAETDPFKQIEEYIGSGPFVFKKDEWKPGEKLVYTKFAKYKPRAEPMSGLSGGKVVNVDRVEWVWIPDAETQVNALLNGEIDYLEGVSVRPPAAGREGQEHPRHQGPCLQPVRLPAELAAAALQQREDPPGRRAGPQPGGLPAGQYRRQALLPDLQGDVHLRLAAGDRCRHGRPGRGQCRQGQGAAGGSRLRRHAGHPAGADRPRRHQAARPGGQGAARDAPASRSTWSRWTGRA